jgi:hypothetical protein
LLGLFDENGRFTAAMLSSISPKIKIFWLFFNFYQLYWSYRLFPAYETWLERQILGCGRFYF